MMKIFGPAATRVTKALPSARRRRQWAALTKWACTPRQDHLRAAQAVAEIRGGQIVADHDHGDVAGGRIGAAGERPVHERRLDASAVQRQRRAQQGDEGDPEAAGLAARVRGRAHAPAAPASPSSRASHPAARCSASAGSSATAGGLRPSTTHSASQPRPAEMRIDRQQRRVQHGAAQRQAIGEAGEHEGRVGRRPRRDGPAVEVGGVAQLRRRRHQAGADQGDDAGGRAQQARAGGGGVDGGQAHAARLFLRCNGAPHYKREPK
jgi:hypothetical protein